MNGSETRVGCTVAEVMQDNGYRPKEGDRLISARGYTGPVAEVAMTTPGIYWLFMVMDTEEETLWQKQNVCFPNTLEDIMEAVYAN